ncbi:MAG: hypothetical protein WD052_09275 [Bacteroidales bacterium]
MMNKLFAILILTSLPLFSFGQPPLKMVEKVLLVTDRSLYVAGETLFFSSRLFTNEHNPGLQSKIIYIELVTPSGEQISGHKFKLQNLECSGSLKIPENINSGNYYIRAYTKYMRNFDPRHFGYASLKFVNPYKKDLLRTNGDQDTVPAAVFSGTTDTTDYFNLTTNAVVYGTREVATISITPGASDNNPILFAVVSVIPANSGLRQKLEFQGEETLPDEDHFTDAERNGITISGVVRNQESGERIPGAQVNLTLLGENNNLFYPVLSGKNGDFVCSLSELYNNHDLFINAQTETGTPELFIDYDFYSKPVKWPSPWFILTEGEKAVALNFAGNEKVKKYFNGSGNTGQDKRFPDITEDTIPFYGRAPYMVYTDDYIYMPTLSDFFAELILPLRIKRLNKTRYISIVGDDAELSMYPPLIMVDYIRVDDAEEILKIDPDKVSRFDIVPAPYVRGEITYGGILNILSKNNDFAGIKLPESGLFLNYQFPEQPDANVGFAEKLPDHLPDTRNTLYWNPRLEPDTSVTFHTADTKGEYLIRVDGFRQDGTMVSSGVRFTVK